jgi:GNAT superfamily N-acetyltransferase
MVAGEPVPAGEERLRVWWAAQPLAREAEREAMAGTLRVADAYDYEALARQALASLFAEEETEGVVRVEATRRVEARLAWRRAALAAVQVVEREVEGLDHPAELMLDGVQVGKLHYRVCTRCGAGQVAKLSIDDDLRRGGLGSRALGYLRDRYPDVQWTTTSQTSDAAQQFWRDDRTQAGGWPRGSFRCVHRRQ